MTINVPLFDLNFDSKEENAVLKTLKSKWISTGPRTIEFEKLFANMIGATYAVAVTNCTAALHLALILAGIKENDEVICPSLTFAATVNVIRYVNARPVFCDINGPEDLTINAKMIESLITKKTKAIIVMHYGGFPCDMDLILKMAQKHKLKVIEDASHAPLSEFKSKKLGTIGDIGCFSFFSNKNISIGEGGMIVTDNEEYFRIARLLRSHGMTTLSYERSKGHSSGYDIVNLGYNYRLDDIRASIGIAQLKKLKMDLKKRIQLRLMYIEQLKETGSIIIPFLNNPSFVSNYIFPIVLNGSNSVKRDKVRNYLLEKGIQTSIHYPPVHRFSIYKKFRTNLPNTEYVSDNEITLPFYSKLSSNNIKLIANEIKNAIKIFPVKS